MKARIIRWLLRFLGAEPPAPTETATVDRLCTVVERTNDTVRAMALVVAEMKRANFTYDPPPVVRPPEPDLPPEVEDALEQVSRPGSALHRRLRVRAERDLAQRRDPKRVARGILRGGDAEPDERDDTDDDER